MEKFRITNGSLFCNFDDNGIWIKNEIKTSIIFTCIDNGIYGMDEDNLKIICKKDNRSKNTIKDWGDGTYTIYLNQDGQPIYFYPYE